MSSFGARAMVFCFSVILVPLTTGWMPLAAQSSSYHLESDDRAPGRQPLLLVNDSEKSIEAYGASQLCFKPKTYTGVPDDSRDILDHPFGGVTSDMRAADGNGPPRSGVLETGARWRTQMATQPEWDCRTQVNAVLFSDGSFEGEDAAVRGLKARRDGLAAAINYWADRVRREQPDGSTLDALHDELKKRKAEDLSKRGKYQSHPHLTFDGAVPPVPPQLLEQYWSGWLSVETNLEFHLSKYLTQEKAGEGLQKFVDEIDQWKAKIDGNLALQKLNVVCPPISESSESKDR
jgi:hypothetical protein